MAKIQIFHSFHKACLSSECKEIIQEIFYNLSRVTEVPNKGEVKTLLPDNMEELFTFHVMNWIQESLLPGEEYCFAESFLGTFFPEDIRFKIISWKTSLKPIRRLFLHSR